MRRLAAIAIGRALVAVRDVARRGLWHAIRRARVARRGRGGRRKLCVEARIDSGAGAVADAPPATRRRAAPGSSAGLHRRRVVLDAPAADGRSLRGRRQGRRRRCVAGRRGGTIVRFAGGELSTIPSPTSALAAIWATRPKDVWVGGPPARTAGTVRRWSHRSLDHDHPGSRGVSALWGCAPTTSGRWARSPPLGRTAAGRRCQRPSDALFTDRDFRTVWGSACDDVWTGSLVDASGTGAIYHFDGGTWTRRRAAPGRGASRASADRHVWSLAQGRAVSLERRSSRARSSATASSACPPIGTGSVGVMNDARQVSLLGGATAPTPLSAPAPDGTSTLRGLGARTTSGASARWAPPRTGTARAGSVTCRPGC